MARVIVGGRAIEVALPNFKALKAAWRYIAAAQSETDPMAGIDAILGVISVGALGDPVSIAELEERLAPSELGALRTFINTLMVEVGLAASPGESAPPMGEASPSAETSTPLSPNSSLRGAPAATGTA